MLSLRDAQGTPRAIVSVRPEEAQLQLQDKDRKVVFSAPGTLPSFGPQSLPSRPLRLGRFAGVGRNGCPVKSMLFASVSRRSTLVFALCHLWERDDGSGLGCSIRNGCRSR
jgi:hypothetical protein